MNARDPELDPLLAALRDGPVAVTSSDASERQRARIVHSLRRQVQQIPGQRRRRRVLRRVQAGAVAFVALASAWVFYPHNSALEPVALRLESVGGAPLLWVEQSGSQRSLNSAADLEGAGSLQVPQDSSAQLVTADRVHLELARSSSLRVDQAQSELYLQRGEVHCQVPPLGKVRSFSVATRDARVVVHGTDFTVRVSDDATAPAQTCVRVREGLVEVQVSGESHFVKPGEQWGCDEPTRAARAAEPSLVPTTASSLDVRGTLDDRTAVEPLGTAREHRNRKVAAKASRPGNTRALAPLPLKGTLDAEIRLLSGALAAERTQDYESARRLFGQLVARYPESPLGPEARAGLNRLR